MNFPNFLSSVRILIALIAPFYLIEGTMWVRVIAGAVCTIAVEGETYTPHALKQISENIQDDLGSIEYV